MGHRECETLKMKCIIFVHLTKNDYFAKIYKITDLIIVGDLETP